MTYLIFVFLLQLSPTEFAYQRAEGTPQVVFESMSDCEHAIEHNAIGDMLSEVRKEHGMVVSAVCVTALAKN